MKDGLWVLEEAGDISTLCLSADTSAAAESEGVVLSGFSLMEEGITAQNVSILSCVDFGGSKTILQQECLISAWHSVLLLPEVM